MSFTAEAGNHEAMTLADLMNTQGYARIEGLPAPDDLAQLRAFVQAHAERHQGEYFAYHGEQHLTHNVLVQLCSSPQLKQLLGNLYRLATGHDSLNSRIFPVLRCVQGAQGRRQSNCFHFDASLVTVLVPIHIPTEGQERGDLMLFPNLRGAHQWILINLLQKALLQNRFSRWLMGLAIKRGWLKPMVLPLVPGNLYLFWGYRTLHSNQPCSPGLMRATLLLHFGDPHSGSLATRLILKFNQRRAARISARVLRDEPPQPS
ncbi:hypothetical protein IFR09_21510 [Pseudomonas syringae]|nr:hypothetical protein [Pseudomonas syringae]MBD8788797.1 hypothetical protein [Pseudomonas syringae]MBD8803033.1 hypothetical protein [Pseudomonas syringae]MBD8813744.1 hypothetical protein [Pseudomonas syringae]